MVGKPLVIAIDGPAGAGKSAAAKELAFRLGLPYLDTGAMYRAVALRAWRDGVREVGEDDGQARVVALARSLRLVFDGDPRAQRVLLDGEDVTDELRTPEVSRLASLVSALPEVRRELVGRQRELGALGGGVVEGRDIGTVVFPDARVKVFLTAAPETRARRRFEELRRRGVPASWDEVAAEQRERDLRDATREDSPMVPAANAVVVDSSVLTLAQVVEKLLAIVSSSLDTGTGRPL